MCTLNKTIFSQDQTFEVIKECYRPQDQLNVGTIVHEKYVCSKHRRQNSLKHTLPRLLTPPLFEIISMIIIMASVAIFIVSTCGCLGDGLSLRAMIVASEKKTTFMGLFALMTVADMVLLAVGTGLQVYGLASPEEHHLPGVQAAMDYISSIALVATAGLSVDRYLAVKTYTHLQIWNKSVTMGVIIFTVVIVSSMITPWTSHFTSDPMCGASKWVMASNAFTYLSSMALVAGTFGLTCSLSRWILKMGTRVAAVETRPRQNYFNDKKNQMSSAMTVRWIILVEVLSFACLSSISFIGLIHDKKCASTVSSQWWYRLLQASPKSLKPFLLMFVSRFFRQSVFTSDTNQNASHNTDRSSSLVQSSSGHLNDTSEQHIFSVANTIISHESNHQSHLKAVATIQGRPYPFRCPEPVDVRSVTTDRSVSPISIIGDRNPTYIDTTYKPTISLYQLHMLPTQDPMQALEDRPPSRNEQISVRFTCDFTFSSCPDLSAAVSDEGCGSKSFTARERAETLERLVPAKPQHHPNNASLNIEQETLERDMSETTDYNPTTTNGLHDATTPHREAQRWDSMCNLAEKTYSLPLAHLKESTADFHGSQCCWTDVHSSRQSPLDQSVSGILLIDDKDASTQVWEAVTLSPIPQSEECSEKIRGVITDNEVPTVVSPWYSESGKSIKKTVMDLSNSIDCDSVFDMKERNEHKGSTKRFRRQTICSKYCLGQEAVDMKTTRPRQRHPSAPTTYDNDSTDSRQENLSKSPRSFCFPSFRRQTVKFLGGSDGPQEPKLAFCDPQPSRRQSESEPAVTFTGVRPHPDMTDSMDMVRSFPSPLASPKLSASVYDQYSHVYLGPYESPCVSNT